MKRVTILPPAHSFLRRATRRQHQQIDQTSVLAALMTPGLTVSLYRTAMQALQRAYQQIDCVLSQRMDLCPEAIPQYSPRLPRIDHDLRALASPADDRWPTRPYLGLKSPETEAAYLGMRYVVEGAQLGSRLIYSHLCTAFGDALREFGSFWMPDAILQSSWPGVLKSLARVDSRESLADAAYAARATFRHMGLYLAVNENEAV